MVVLSICSVVENLEIRREPLPSKEAIYLIEPCRNSVQAVIDDFDPEKNDSKKDQYAAIHLLFTSPLDDSLFQKLTQSKARAYISSLKELNLLFYLQEPQVFHTESPDSMKIIWSPLSDKGAIADHLADVANKLSTVFTTIEEYPLIRYDKRSAISKKLASCMKEKLESLQQAGIDLPAKVNAPSDERCTLLILDRSFDLVAPFLHEFTYQAMIYDLLDVDDKHRISHTYTDNAGKEQTRKVVLSDESDQLWCRLRHMHIADTSKWVVKNFNEFIAANKKAGNLEMGKATTLKEMGDAMRAMPQYQDMKSKYAIHIELANQCMTAFKQKNLREIGMLEQDMVVGEKRKNLKKDLGEFFNSDEVSKSDKLRLFLLYIISQVEQGKLSFKDKEEMAVEAGFPNDPQGDAKILRCLSALGIKLDKASLKESAKEAKEKEKEEKKAKKKDDDDEASYELSRYIPKLKRTVESLLKNELQTAQFPYVDPPSHDVTVESSGSSSSSKAKWGKGKEKEAGAKFSKGRVIVFVLGGATFSEIRSVYELTDAYQREVILGSFFLMKTILIFFP